MKQAEAYYVTRKVGDENVDVLVTVVRTTANFDGKRKSCYKLERHTWGYDTMIVSTRAMVKKALEVI